MERFVSVFVYLLLICLVQGVLKPFCDLLAAKDDKVVCVVLDGVTNILTTAEKLGEVDKVAMMVEECGGLDRIEALQSHENETIYHKALQIIESFFTGDDQVSVGSYCGHRSDRPSVGCR